MGQDMRGFIEEERLRRSDEWRTRAEDAERLCVALAEALEQLADLEGSGSSAGRIDATIEEVHPGWRADVQAMMERQLKGKE
jgi:hypothetical protein